MTAKANRKQSKKYRATLGPTVWLSANHAWEITQDEHGHMLTDWIPDRASSARSYRVTPNMHDDRALDHARRFQTLPVYVVEAMRQHCQH